METEFSVWESLAKYVAKKTNNNKKNRKEKPRKLEDQSRIWKVK